jgi:hypothetical protein
MRLVPLRDLKLARDQARHHIVHGVGGREMMLLAAARLLEQAGDQDELDHGAALTRWDGSLNVTLLDRFRRGEAHVTPGAEPRLCSLQG